MTSRRQIERHAHQVARQREFDDVRVTLVFGGEAVGGSEMRVGDRSSSPIGRSPANRTRAFRTNIATYVDVPDRSKS